MKKYFQVSGYWFAVACLFLVPVDLITPPLATDPAGNIAGVVLRQTLYFFQFAFIAVRCGGENIRREALCTILWFCVPERKRNFSLTCAGVAAISLLLCGPLVSLIYGVSIVSLAWLIKRHLFRGCHV